MDTSELIAWIQARELKAPSPMSFRWYTKRGYADWCSAEAVSKERKEIIKHILEMENNNGNGYT